MKDFQVISEAEDSYHIKHKNGKAFTVDKKGLSPKAKDVIQKLCGGGGVMKYAEGGDVQMPPEGFSDINETVMNQPVIPTPAAEPQVTPQAQESQFKAPPVASPAAQPVPVDPLVQNRLDMNQLLNKKEADVKSAMSGINSAGADAQSAYRDANAKLALMKSPEDLSNEYKSKDDALLKDYMNTKVDPNRYFANQSTGSKILSGIGIALSGMGAGANGRNLALETIQNAVNNDIAAQQNEQSKKLNLWKMNREQYKDDMQATLATQNQILTGVQAKVAMAGSATQNAEARLKGSQLINDIEQEKMSNRMRLGLLGGGQQGAGSGGANPLDLVSQFVPPEHQKQAITEIGQAQSAVENEDKIKKLFYQAAKDTRPASGRSATSLMNTVPGYNPPSIKALNLLYDPLIHDNEGRINELEQQHVQANSPQFGDSDETVDKKWNEAIKPFIDHKKSAPTARTFGINMDNFRSTSSDPIARLSPQEKTYYNWAKANPSSPVAKAWLEKNGIR